MLPDSKNARPYIIADDLTIIDPAGHSRDLSSLYIGPDHKPQPTGAGIGHVVRLILDQVMKQPLYKPVRTHSDDQELRPDSAAYLQELSLLLKRAAAQLTGETMESREAQDERLKGQPVSAGAREACIEAIVVLYPNEIQDVLRLALRAAMNQFELTRQRADQVLSNAPELLRGPAAVLLTDAASRVEAVIPKA